MKGHLRPSGQTVLKSPETPELVKMWGKWAWRGRAPREPWPRPFVCHSLVDRSRVGHLPPAPPDVFPSHRLQKLREELRGKVGCVPVASLFLLLTHESVGARVHVHTHAHTQL